MISADGLQKQIPSNKKAKIAKEILDVDLPDMPRKSPLDKVLGKLDDLDEVNLSNLVQRLARERKLLETVFDVIRDGILVLDQSGIITYSNQQGRRLIGLKPELGEKVSLLKAAPDLAKSLGMDRLSVEIARPEVVVREIRINYPEKRYLRVYAVPIEGTLTEKFLRKMPE